MTKVETKIEGEELIVIFEKTHPTIVNSIRRTILDDVPTLAIDDVEIVKNDSGMFDEIIAHRLGLLPLKTPLDTYNFKSECKCGGIGCSLCEVKLSLKKEEPGYVYASDLKSNDPEVYPVYGETPIVKLFGNQVLELNCVAVLGKGRNHAKWAPAHSYLSNDEDNKILLHIESFGQLENKDIYNKAVEILKENLNKFKEELN